MKKCQRLITSLESPSLSDHSTSGKLIDPLKLSKVSLSSVECALKMMEDAQQ